MILRFKLLSIAGATALLSTPSDAFTPTKLLSIAGATALLSTPSDAFTPHTTGFQRAVSHTTTSPSRAKTLLITSTSLQSSRLSPGWDNEDFLGSLGGDQDDVDAANEKYFKQSENRAAMNQWKAENSPSPEFFQKMGLTGGDPPQQPQQQQQQQPPPSQQPMQPPPQMGTPPPQMQPPPAATPQQQPAQQQQFFDANGNPVSLPMVYDANGNLVPFNPQQPPQTQQPAQNLPPQINPRPSQFTVPEPPLPKKTKGTDDPRPVGYNPDAYTMSNTADVYFAQLKQDSKVRKMARLGGDIETSNKVFADDSVRQIGESWTDNPYTKEKNMAEARAEIEGSVRLQTQGDDAPEITSGISYKQKLEMMKAKRAGGGTMGQQVEQQQKAAPPSPSPAAVAATATAVSAPPPPKVEEPKVATAPPKLGQPIDSQKVGIPPPPKVEEPKKATLPPPPVAPAVPATPAAPVASTPAAGGAPDEDPMRGQVRTLQGLLLKHRGGPGFGAGRLKAPEAKRLEDTLTEVTGALRSEAGMPAVVDAKPAAAAPKPVAPVAESKPVPPPPVAAAPAATTTPPSSSEEDPLAGTIACVEAAVKMYKEAPPAEKDGLLMPLRQALMAAASASNKYIAEAEIRAHRAAMEAGPASPGAKAVAAAPVEKAAAPMMGFPTTYAVTKPEEEEEAAPAPAAAAPASTAGRTENEKKLEEVYDALLQASGEGGKLGLKNISGAEAAALADKIVAMRGVLLDELNGD
eukprot:CAMPEP_0183726258 /NCGR_PEP_ID=MMETSP0737-20130205/22906_1 /TAXON_ID=385413 /ORGANISM="Thalassiosira miniscula, Strain CCMP1093" /LENGTH=745 /DNA_ID=CAMNT_0025957559 /DNA_START=109 /DNA_END=2346 /DNA_ORIENTATION=-